MDVSKLLSVEDRFVATFLSCQTIDGCFVRFLGFYIFCHYFKGAFIISNSEVTAKLVLLVFIRIQSFVKKNKIIITFFL